MGRRSRAATGYFVFRRLSENLFHRLGGANLDVVKRSAALVYAIEERPAD